MRGDDAVASTRPDHGNLCDLCLAPLAALAEHAAKRLVGENAGKVVHAAVAFGFADDRNHLVRSEFAGSNARLQAGGVLHALELDLRNLHRHSCYASSRIRGAPSPRSI